MEGKLTPNDILDRAELVVDGQFIGPESVAVLGNDVYTGCQGGSIIKVDEKGTWKKVAQIDSGDCGILIYCYIIIMHSLTPH